LLKLKALGKIFGETSPLDPQNFTYAQVTKSNIPFISSETRTSFALLVSLGLYHIRLVNSLINLSYDT